MLRLFGFGLAAIGSYFLLQHFRVSPEHTQYIVAGLSGALVALQS
jgi:hypothetical protein